MPRSFNLTLLAWRIVPRLPAGLVGAVFHGIGVGAWAWRGKGVRQLERNLSRVRPQASRRQVRRLGRRAMVAYMLYYAEVFHAASLTRDQVDARIRVKGLPALKAAVERDTQPVLVLAHMGNWDYAGAWASRALGVVTTVAERLNPPELFEDFVRLRAQLGIEIVPADAGRAFRPLVRAIRSGVPGIVPLLADRDLSRKGVEVTMFGTTARVAAGPATLARLTGTTLLPLAVYSERLTGGRRRAAGAKRGYVMDVLAEVHRRPDLDAAGEVQAMTQAWATALSDSIAQHPTDWHMLQKVFVEDLDTAKDAQIRGG
ncbi:MAG: phosphatidylinositol mannoside acyltransferase [Bifidobacteriaceae bacterium]|jgi:KDO2-lipid IV(A) lauroyltransferase|nr:phosphatidylinositol mannoside acyltransferase [Bifidobacteriaceae bacterium]